MKELLTCFGIVVASAAWYFAGRAAGEYRATKLAAADARRKLEERQAAERAALADMSEALRKLAIEDSTLLMFDGENVRQVSYSGPSLNSYKGGSC